MVWLWAIRTVAFLRVTWNSVRHPVMLKHQAEYVLLKHEYVLLKDNQKYGTTIAYVS